MIRFAFAAIFLALVACQPQAPTAAVTPAGAASSQTKGPQVPAFALSDQHGQPFSEQQLKDRWTFLFFGFTNCPDVCPMTLAVLARVWDNLAAEPAWASRLQVILVSVDPERDTAEALQAYVSRFNPQFIGLRGEMTAVNELAKPLGIYSERQVHPEHAGHIEVKHSPAVLLVGPDLGVRKLFTPPFEVTAMTAISRDLNPPVVP